MEKGSEEFLWVSHVVPLSCVVHKGEVSPAPVIIDVREKQGFQMQPDQYEGGSHFDVIPEFLCSCHKW